MHSASYDALLKTIRTVRAFPFSVHFRGARLLMLGALRTAFADGINYYIVYANVRDAQRSDRNACATNTPKTVAAALHAVMTRGGNGIARQL